MKIGRCAVTRSEYIKPSRLFTPAIDIDECGVRTVLTEAFDIPEGQGERVGPVWPSLC